MGQSIPTPELTRRYLKLKDLPSAERLLQARDMHADVLAAEYNAAVNEFREFSALPTKTFYDQDSELRDLDKSPESDTRTYGWGMAMKKATISVDGEHELD